MKKFRVESLYLLVGLVLVAGVGAAGVALTPREQVVLQIGRLDGEIERVEGELGRLRGERERLVMVLVADDPGTTGTLERGGSL